MKNVTISVPAPAAALLDELEAAGYEAWLVGGCVRDSLLGSTPGDWDVTTSALPEEMQRVFAGRRVIETGLKHGTLTVLADDRMPVEITTYRIDGGYSDARHPDRVSFTRNLHEDLSRRDFRSTPSPTTRSADCGMTSAGWTIWRTACCAVWVIRKGAFVRTHCACCGRCAFPRCSVFRLKQLPTPRCGRCGKT